MSTKTEKESGFFWHWQNLKEQHQKMWLHGRAWLHKRPRGTLGVEWCIPTSSFGVDVTIGGNDQIRASVSCLLFSLHLHLSNWNILRAWEAANDWHGKETSFGIHHWSLWWKVWVDEMEWKASTPKWRDGCFDIPDFLFGRAKYTAIDEPPIPVVIPMPEGEYLAKVVFSTRTWKRPRWPIAKQRKDATVEIEGRGIPIPGKGESDYDCDDTAYTSIGTSATTVVEAVEQAIRAVSKRRERYGGEGWTPARVREEDSSGAQ